MSASDVFLDDCPARTTLSLIADRWSVLVIVGLGGSPQQYSRLSARIQGISNKMLTQTLRRLQENGLVHRVRLATNPPATGYALTELGSSLVPLVGTLIDWAQAHTDEIVSAQQSNGSRP